ncbi:hypothetical protein [Megasphaera elsdenii]|jgi:SPP1 gp7 family putative phage head morphogenesis protein|uniref:hypothetical protein n=1 Tax=Megasphaera elsdenii TaxID=907 RepID=UPI00242A5997|nr:hypothetical protein [Megasphaera elsdenii]
MAQEMPAELNYVENQSAMDSIKEAGMKYYRFSATLDRRKSATCREHDGHVYPIDEYQPRLFIQTAALPLREACTGRIRRKRGRALPEMTRTRRIMCRLI